MKFVKSSLAKKLIIILVALMIFNIAVPHEVKAWDVAGVLFKPFFLFCVSCLTSVDVALGLFINGITGPIAGIGAIVDALTAPK